MSKAIELLKNADGVLAYISPGRGGRVKTARDFIQKSLVELEQDEKKIEELEPENKRLKEFINGLKLPQHSTVSGEGECPCYQCEVSRRANQALKGGGPTSKGVRTAESGQG